MGLDVRSAHGELRLASVLYEGRRFPVGPEGLTIGREDDNGIVLRSERASRHHARVFAENGEYRLADLGSTNGTLLNGERLVGETRELSNGDTITIGAEVLRVLTGEETRMASRELPVVGTQVVELAGERLTIGRDESNDVVLANPNVSRFHAEVVVADGQVTVRDLGSRNGTRLDGRPVEQATLEAGSALGIGPFRLIFDGKSFLSRDDRGALRLDAEGVGVEVKGKRILASTSLSVEPGELVAIIGESGSGKSTLVKALAGVTPPSEGRVTVNGEPVGARLTDIGYVPQDEIVHRLLTVLEALRYAARLRLPHDVSVEEIDATVETVLGELSLDEHSGTMIGSLSGGQRKRAGVAAELLNHPSLLFLDEPTTGLDPGLETRMMELLRALADRARAVTVVTHATKNLALCDKLVVMGQGGELCFCGPPQEALEFFGVDTPDGIYTALDQRPAGEWRRTFESASAEAPAGALTEQVEPTVEAPAAPRGRREHSLIGQTRVLAHRYIRLLLRDRRNLLLLLGQVPLLALAIAGLFKAGVFELGGGDASDGIQVLFLLVMTTIWLGSIDASRELIKEKSVYLRESAVGTRLSAYLLSKALVLFALVAVQAVILTGIVLAIHPLHEPLSVYAAVVSTLVFTGFVAIGMGLLVSGAVRSEDQATSFIPLILIPQLLFAGTIVPVEQMSGLMARISQLVFAQWSFASIGTAVDMNARIEVDPKLSRFNDFGFGFFDLSQAGGFLILAAFLVVFFAGVAVLLRRQA